MNFLRKLFDLFVLIFLALSTLTFSVLVYVMWIWPHIDFEQIFMTAKDLTPRIIASNATLWDYFFSFLFFTIIYPLFYLFLDVKKRFFVGIGLCILTLYISGYFSYIINSHRTSNIYEEEYIKSDDIQITFPEKKRNLILIYLESFEQNFSSAKHYEKNLIPNLSKLRDEGQYSLMHKNIRGTDYSIASIVSSQCGVPLRFIQDADIWASKFFLPQAVCFVEVLKNNNYQTAIVKASDITFSNVNVFALSHGYNIAQGASEILQTIPQDLHNINSGTFGGVTDRTLWNYAKLKLEEFDKSKPFMLTLFSLDTHTPGYFNDAECSTEFNDLRDSYLCSDKAIGDFIEWLKKSEYWENTTVVIMGDHLLPSKIKTKGKIKRGIFNVFLNLPEELKINKNKVFSTIDLAPTLLESIGIKLSPRSFGLGRSIFSDEPTLIDKMGDKFKLLLAQNSNFYNKLNTPTVKRRIKYIDYTLGTTLNNDNIIQYTDAYENIINSNFIDQLHFNIANSVSDLKVKVKFNIILSFNHSSRTIYANGKEVYNFSPNKKQPMPFIVEFDIPKEYIKNGKLSLKFATLNNGCTSIQRGIAPVEFVIEEKK